MVSGEVLIDRVSTAYWNTRHMPKVQLVQGDICHPPLAEDAFDLVYNIGVLHADWFDRLAAPICLLLGGPSTGISSGRGTSRSCRCWRRRAR